MPHGRVYGVEANFVKRFRDDLPGVWGGLGVSANLTWVDSWYRLGTRVSVLPATCVTPEIGAAVEKYGLELSLGAYLTSRNIFTQGPTAATDTGRRIAFRGFRWQLSGHDWKCRSIGRPEPHQHAAEVHRGINENRVIQREFYGA